MALTVISLVRHVFMRLRGRQNVQRSPFAASLCGVLRGWILPLLHCACPSFLPRTPPDVSLSAPLRTVAWVAVGRTKRGRPDQSSAHACSSGAIRFPGPPRKRSPHIRTGMIEMHDVQDTFPCSAGYGYRSSHVKNEQGCWPVSEFELNASHIRFP